MRQELEALSHPLSSSFCSLTYNDDNLPEEANLDPRDLQLFFKRLRKALAPLRIRFFAVGEYSHEAKRPFNPHYHFNLFGVPWLSTVNGEPIQSVIDRSWGKGFVTVSEFNTERARYCAGYVVKKMTRHDDDRLEGRWPEFARMSNRPGIGAFAMSTLAQAIGKQLPHVALNMLNGATVTISGRTLNLGRYLSRKLRELFPDQTNELQALKDISSHERSAQLLALFQAALSDTPTKPITLKSVYKTEVAQRILQINEKSKRQYNSKRKL